ncbi:MAG: HEPN domain-containing protein [Nitrospiraceae bacterium]|nr:MAG: HEPN domain-containing protein [Nitrospiraceae bacterium]
MSEDKLIKKLHEIMSKSSQSLDDATLLYKKSSYDSSASLAYYAVFHAIQALLLTKGLAFSKHTQVKGAFNKEFIHTGIFPKSFTGIVERLFKDRQIGDYEYSDAKDKHPLERASDLHAEFESIHPFIDGNGRIGRLLLSIFTMKNGYCPVIIPPIRRAEYISALQKTNKRDLNALRTLLLSVVYEEMKSLLKLVESLVK